MESPYCVVARVIMPSEDEIRRAKEENKRLKDDIPKQFRESKSSHKQGHGHGHGKNGSNSAHKKNKKKSRSD